MTVCDVGVTVAFTSLGSHCTPNASQGSLRLRITNHLDSQTAKAGTKTQKYSTNWKSRVACAHVRVAVGCYKSRRR